MSQERADELQIQRPAKVAKLDALSLRDLLVDEPPAIEVNNSGSPRYCAGHGGLCALGSLEGLESPLFAFYVLAV